PYDRYRPREVARSGSPSTRAPVPLAALAKLDERGELGGVAATYLLAGAREQAAAILERAGRSPDLDSDRAALAVERGELESALTLLEEVLAAQPRHAQALWNRAVVLGKLGLLLYAAQAWDQAAELHESGWAEEARAQARALRTRAAERRTAYQSAL